MTTLDELKTKRQPNREAVEAHKQRMLAEVRAYKLRELREQYAMTQVQLAKELDISQNRVSSIEHGDLAKTQVSTLQRYVAALGGKLQLVAQFGDEAVRIA